MWPYLYDLILIIILVSFFFRGYRHGIISSLLRVCGWLLAFILIVFFAAEISDWIFDTFLCDIFINTVNKYLPQDLISNVNAAAISTQESLNDIQEAIAALPSFLGEINIDTSSFQEVLELMKTDGITLAESITENIIRPVALPLIRLICSLLILILCVNLFNALSRMSIRAQRRRRKNISGTFNKVLGGILGIAEGFIFSVLYSYTLSILAPFFSDKVSFFGQEIFNSTLLVRHFANFI